MAEQGNQPASKGLIIAGYIFALLGGLIGVVIGAYLKFNKVTDESGTKVARYDTSSQNQGLIILAIAIVSMVVWRVVASL